MLCRVQTITALTELNLLLKEYYEHSYILSLSLHIAYPYSMNIGTIPQAFDDWKTKTSQEKSIYLNVIVSWARNPLIRRATNIGVTPQAIISEDRGVFHEKFRLL